MSRSDSATAVDDRPPRLILTAGDPAGIGPDLCVTIAGERWPGPVAVVGDPQVLRERAASLGVPVAIDLLDAGAATPPHSPGRLQVIPTPVNEPVRPGRPSAANAASVLRGLELAIAACRSGSADAMVTAPVSKAVLSAAGAPFSGHTEFIAAACGVPTPVMLLCGGSLRVALATTHLPLSDVPGALTRDRLDAVLRVLHRDLRRRFGIDEPRILVCGLNPHAGESGHLGREEIETIGPVLEALRGEGFSLTGPLPADTLFLPQRLETADAVLAMYHDQGLPVLKHAAFGEAVNVTLGLPFVRTSVDHGTAFDIAGTGRADAGSLRAAIRLAVELAATRHA